jgi:hypothetical protein
MTGNEEHPVRQLWRSRRVLAYLLIWSVISPMAVAVAGIVYTNHVQKTAEHHFHQVQVQSDQRWCPLLLIAGKNSPPNQTREQLAAREELRRLLARLRCGE